MRVKFRKGKQREFLQKVLAETNCPSLRELSRRLEINYSTLKNYFAEDRLLPKNLFDLLYKISGVKANAGFLDDNWGQRKGGKS
ncbi:MAG: hypothetical protein AABW50_01795 [Nanoarchaeota archaeon]